MSVLVGSETSVENDVPHCNKSPLSSMAAPKVLSILISRSNFPSKKDMRLGVFMNFSSESGATTLPALDPQAYTPGFSQLLTTCKCCELMMFLLSSLEVARRLGSSNLMTSSSSSCAGSSAWTSPMMLPPLHHCQAVAVAQRAVTVATERMKCCCRRCAYGCVAVRTCGRWDRLVIFLHSRGVRGVRSVARAMLLLVSMVGWDGWQM